MKIGLIKSKIHLECEFDGNLSRSTSSNEKYSVANKFTSKPICLQINSLAKIDVIQNLRFLLSSDSQVVHFRQQLCKNRHEKTSYAIDFLRFGWVTFIKNLRIS